MKKTILLTRPRASSQRFAGLLAQYGFACAIEPLLAIAPTGFKIPDAQFQAVMITSANALDALPEERAGLVDILALPCFCVGKTTGDAARVFGFTDIKYGASDSRELAQIMAIALSDKTRALLHIAGDIVDNKAHDILTEKGFTLTQWAVYRAIAAEDFTPEIKALLASGGVDAIPVFSVRSAEILVALIEKNDLSHACRSIVAVGLSQAVADVLHSLPWRRLAVAAYPSEEKILSCLQTELL